MNLKTVNIKGKQYVTVNERLKYFREHFAGYSLTSEITHLNDLTLNELLVFVLHIVDLALVGNLVLMVIFAGYENFVSKIDIANQSEDKPEWMGKLDFSGLKLKLIASIVAISSIGLLEAFIDVGSKTSEEIYLMIFIHAVFILSGLVIAIMDYISGITKHHP